MSDFTSQPVRIECGVSEGFQAWMAQTNGSLVLSTYQAGKVATIGWDGRQVTLLMRQFDKPLGLAVDGSRLALAHRHDVTLFANAPLLAHDYQEDQPGKYDALYLPRATWHTGDLHTHDITFCDGELLLVNTRFSCLARLSSTYNFEPIWRPPFVGDIVPEDRCHLNGLALVDGRAKYMTALGATDTPGGWREKKADGGVLVDIESNETILTGLSMPHSPRWHDGRLWLLNSGAGELLLVDPAGGKSEVVCGLRGYLRGLTFVGPYALVGLCKIREKHIFGGLPIQKQYEKLLCGVAIIDLRRATEVGMFEFTSGCEELYDVQFLSGIRRPMILNLEKPAVRQAVSNPDSSYWLRASSEIHDTSHDVPPAAMPAEYA
ncbi:MAG: TIGR03032 family protein [Rhodopirellula sp.]|nr:TIGR03032 family protein [Rhodopirellula sp.]